MRLRHIIMTLLLALSAMPNLLLAQQDAGVAEITSPLESQQLFGLVEITGTASHPSQFEGYLLEWSNAQNPDVWLPIQELVTQQVTNGLLGQWDTVTAGIPDGIYQIRLRVFIGDGSVLDTDATNLQLVNSPPTDIPTVPSVIQPTATIPLVPTQGASPTPLIELPPTVTPRPTFEQPVIEPIDEGGDDAFVNFSAVEGAICNGVIFSFVLFGLVVGYLLVRTQLSPYTRRIWWQIRSEIDNDQ